MGPLSVHRIAPKAEVRLISRTWRLRETKTNQDYCSKATGNNNDLEIDVNQTGLKGP
jgi:hypothetical protein